MQFSKGTKETTTSLYCVLEAGIVFRSSIAWVHRTPRQKASLNMMYPTFKGWLALLTENPEVSASQELVREDDL